MVPKTNKMKQTFTQGSQTSHLSGYAESLAPVDESEGSGSQENIEKLKTQSKNSENKRVENRLASEADIGSFGVPNRSNVGSGFQRKKGVENKCQKTAPRPYANLWGSEVPGPGGPWG